MLNLILKMQNLSDFSYFLLNIRKVLVNWNFWAHFYASNFVNRLFLQRSQPMCANLQTLRHCFFNRFKREKAAWKPDWRFSDGLTFQISAQSQKPPSIPLWRTRKHPGKKIPSIPRGKYRWPNTLRENVLLTCLLGSKRLSDGTNSNQPPLTSV